MTNINANFNANINANGESGATQSLISPNWENTPESFNCRISFQETGDADGNNGDLAFADVRED